MKNIKSISSVFMVLVLGLISSSSLAAEDMITYEMGESGYLISFPMTPEEALAAEDVENAIRELEESKVIKRTWVHSYELASSGFTINFPMYKEEIKISREEERLEEMATDLRELKEKAKEKKRYEVFEMADGYTISFEE